MKHQISFRNLFRQEQHDRLIRTLNPVLAILVAFAVSGLVVSISGDSPVEAYTALARGAFGSIAGIRNTIRYMIPILLLAFSFSLCQRCGYFNIGQEGQMYAAATAAAFVSRALEGTPLFLRITAMILSACVVSGVATLIPALFKTLLGINEIVVAVMMNYILSLFSSWTLLYSGIADKNASMPKSLPIPEQISQTGLLAAIIVIILLYQFILRRTAAGYQLRMTGQNSQFARVSGLSPKRVIFTAAFLAGILAGLAAIGEILGVYHIVYDGFAAGMGYNGMTATLIGQHNPIGIVLGAAVLGALQSGSVLLSIDTSVSAEMVQVVQGFVMFFSTVSIIRHSAGKAAAKRGE